jgi:NADPH-dependent ferric siderophore reductase
MADPAERTKRADNNRAVGHETRLEDNMADIPSPRGEGGRPRSPTRPVAVERVERITPRLTRVTFGGDQMAGFGPPRPGAHMKLLFAPDGTRWSPDDEDAPRPPRRTYTPRRYDAGSNTLQVEFVHHGDGLAAQWARAARVGDALFITGPGGGYDIPADATEIVLVADDTALPAAGTILEALPAGCRATLLCEVSDASEERPLSPLVPSSPVWLHRGPAVAGALLEAALRELSARSPDACWWIACEAAAMRRIRRHLLTERGVDAARLHTRGYWKLGETAYPDHDYGRD